MVIKKILIADSSVEFCTSLAEALNNQFTLRICHDGLEAETMLRTFVPDLLVMDLALSNLDGIALLERISTLHNRPKILLTTRFISPYIEHAISGFGVDLVVVKPCNISALVDRILDMTDSEEAPASVSSWQQSSISAMLMDLNIPSKRRGFTYLEMCIRLYTQMPGQPITKAIYPQVAQMYHTKIDAVERAMRQVIHETWKKRDEKVWRMYFRPGREGIIPRPTNAEFISRLAELQKQEMSQEA